MDDEIVVRIVLILVLLVADVVYVCCWFCEEEFEF